MCDTLASEPAPGWCSQELDRPPGESQVLVAHRARAARDTSTRSTSASRRRRVALVASHPSGCGAREHGLNEHGVAMERAHLDRR